VCADTWYVSGTRWDDHFYVVRVEDLKTQFKDAEKTAARLTSGTDAVRVMVMNTQLVFLAPSQYARLTAHRIMDGADASSRRAHEIVEKASDITAALESPATDPDNLLRGMFDACK